MRISSRLIFIAFILSIAPLAWSMTNVTQTPDSVPGQFITTTDKPESEFRQALATNGFRYVEELPFGFHLIEDETHANAVTDRLVAAGARTVQPNFIKRLATAAPGQWALENPQTGADIKAVPAWEYLKTVPGSDRKVRVALIDSGIDLKAPEFSGRIDTAKSYNFVGGNRDIQDYCGHGTHVAGIIGASHGSPSRILGVNPNVEYVVLKSFTMYGFATTGSILKALNAVLGANVRVINASYGSANFDQAELEAMRKIRSAGILFVAAAGNDGQNTDAKPFYPADYDLPNIVSVGASTRVDDAATFSNFGKKTVDVFAPGAAILSSMIDLSFTNRKQVFSLQMQDSRESDWKLNQAIGAGFVSTGPWKWTSCGDQAGSCLHFKPEAGYTPSAKFDFFNLMYENTLASNPEKHYVMVSTAKYHLPSQGWHHEVTGSMIAGGIPGWMLPAGYVRGDSGWGENETDLSKPGLFYAGTTAWDRIYLGYSVNFSGMAGVPDYKTAEMSVKKFAVMSEDPVTKSDLKEFSGTSMAAPHVTGIATWLFAKDPSASAVDVKAKIVASCDPVKALDGKAGCGGRVNLLSAVRSSAH